MTDEILLEEEEQEPKKENGSSHNIDIGHSNTSRRIFAYSYITKAFFFSEGDGMAVAEQRKEIGTVPFGSFVINLNAGTTKRYLKVDLVIGCTEKEDVEKLTEKSYQVRDTIIQTLRKKTVVDVSIPENTNLMKKELRDNINVLFDPDLDIEVYFIDYLIQ